MPSVVSGKPKYAGRRGRPSYALETFRALAEYPHEFGKALGYSELLPVHSAWIKYAWGGEARAFMAARGSYKTTSVIIVGAVRWLLANPATHIGIIYKNFSRASEVMATITGLMETPLVQCAWQGAGGVVQIKPTEKTQARVRFNFDTSPDSMASLQAYGIGGEITGQHLDVLVIDDIVTLTDRVSAAERRRTLRYLQEVVSNVAKSGARIIICGTPWHPQDVWEYVEKHICEIKRYSVDHPDMEFMRTAAVMERRARLPPILDAINYKLELLKDESLLFSEPCWGEWVTDNTSPVYGQLDTAFGGGDTCALTLGQKTESGFQAVGFSYAGHIERWEDKVVALCERYKVKRLYVENNADKGAAGKRLNQLAGVSLRIVDYAENMNKEIKIATYLYQVWGKLVWGRETEPEYMEQVMDWAMGGTGLDDAPDSAASLFKLCWLEKASEEMTAETKNKLFGW
jgi:hypothetical protein